MYAGQTTDARYNDGNATMADVRFENNICANIGDGGWSAAQRPDAAGRGLCSYSTTATTTNVSVRNNIFFQNTGFEAIIYMSQPWSAWAAKGLTLENNVIYRAPNLPQSPTPHEHDEGSEHWLIKTADARIDAGNFTNFMMSTGSCAGTVLVNPLLHNMESRNLGALVSMEQNVTGCRPLARSPALNAGGTVQWQFDFAGAPIPHATPSIGAYQDAE
jgi:hypothetical protein